MTNETLKRANEIVTILESINDARHIMTHPYPSFYHESINEYEEVKFIKFDDETVKDLKDVIRDVLDRSSERLMKELEEL